MNKTTENRDEKNIPAIEGKNIVEYQMRMNAYDMIL